MKCNDAISWCGRLTELTERYPSNRKHSVNYAPSFLMSHGAQTWKHNWRPHHKRAFSSSIPLLLSMETIILARIDYASAFFCIRKRTHADRNHTYVRARARARVCVCVCVCVCIHIYIIEDFPIQFSMLYLPEIFPNQSPTSKARALSNRHIHFVVVGRASARIQLSLRINISLTIGEIYKMVQDFSTQFSPLYLPMKYLAIISRHPVYICY